MNLIQLGWCEHFEGSYRELDDGASFPARVIRRNRADYLVQGEGVPLRAELAGRFHQVSATSGNGVAELAKYLPEGCTGVLLGPSGVGKSSLVNTLLGENRLATQSEREADRRGRHTTTWSQILFLPGGGMIIDTPGMRDVQIWAAEESVVQTFSDIESLTRMCAFRDCAHDRETGCAVLEALANGSLDRKRYEGYIKQRREAEYVARQSDRGEARAHKTREKKLSKLYRKNTHRD